MKREEGVEKLKPSLFIVIIFLLVLIIVYYT